MCRLTYVFAMQCLIVTYSWQVCPKGVADRVNLGLIPSSEEGWPTACAALKPHTGGILHIHANVTSYHGNTTPCDDNSRIIQNRSTVIPMPPSGQIMNYTIRNNGSRRRESNESCKKWINLKSDVSKRTTAKLEWMAWAEQTAKKIKHILETQRGSDWNTMILHVERVKSYAPHINHLVLDLECRPTNISGWIAKGKSSKDKCKAFEWSLNCLNEQSKLSCII